MDCENVNALKELAAAVTGATVDEIEGNTIADVLRYMAQNYPSAQG